MWIMKITYSASPCPLCREAFIELEKQNEHMGGRHTKKKI